MTVVVNPLPISLHHFEMSASKADQFVTGLYCCDDRLMSICRSKMTHFAQWQRVGIAAKRAKQKPQHKGLSCVTKSVWQHFLKIKKTPSEANTRQILKETKFFPFVCRATFESAG